MNTSTIGNWLQIGANIGILCGLVMVAIQINQNTEIARADMVSRGYELAMQHAFTMMGENAAAVWAKAAINPEQLQPEDVVTLHHHLDFWWNKYDRYAYLDRYGLAEPNWKEGLAWHADNTYGGSPLSIAWFNQWREPSVPGIQYSWPDEISERVSQSDGTANRGSIELLLSAVKSDR